MVKKGSKKHITEAKTSKSTDEALQNEVRSLFDNSDFDLFSDDHPFGTVSSVQATTESDICDDADDFRNMLLNKLTPYNYQNNCMKDDIWRFEFLPIKDLDDMVDNMESMEHSNVTTDDDDKGPETAVNHDDLLLNYQSGDGDTSGKIKECFTDKYLIDEIKNMSDNDIDLWSMTEVKKWNSEMIKSFCCLLKARKENKQTVESYGEFLFTLTPPGVKLKRKLDMSSLEKLKLGVLNKYIGELKKDVNVKNKSIWGLLSQYFPGRTGKILKSMCDSIKKGKKVRGDVTNSERNRTKTSGDINGGEVQKEDINNVDDTSVALEGESEKDRKRKRGRPPGSKNKPKTHHELKQTKSVLDPTVGSIGIMTSGRIRSSLVVKLVSENSSLIKSVASCLKDDPRIKEISNKNLDNAARYIQMSIETWIKKNDKDVNSRFVKPVKNILMLGKTMTSPNKPSATKKGSRGKRVKEVNGSSKQKTSHAFKEKKTKSVVNGIKSETCDGLPMIVQNPSRVSESKLQSDTILMGDDRHLDVFREDIKFVYEKTEDCAKCLVDYVDKKVEINETLKCILVNIVDDKTDELFRVLLDPLLKKDDKNIDHPGYYVVVGVGVEHYDSTFEYFKDRGYLHVENVCIYGKTFENKMIGTHLSYHFFRPKDCSIKILNQLNGDVSRSICNGKYVTVDLLDSLVKLFPSGDNTAFLFLMMKCTDEQINAQKLTLNGKEKSSVTKKWDLIDVRN